MKNTHNNDLISIIIISYNTMKLTYDCISSVIQQTSVNYEIIVVDNNSEDGSANMLKDNFSGDANLLLLDENLGFAAANNLAAKSAKGNLLLLLNPDTVVLDRAIDELYYFSKEYPDNLVWGGKTYFPDMSLNPTSCWGKITLWNLFCRAVGLTSKFKNIYLFNSEEYGGWLRDSVRNVDIVTGCFLLITHDIWLEIKGFDKDFFMYAEDADLCLRAGEHGAKPIITPEARIIHYGGASEKIREDKIIRLLLAKNKLMQKHWGKIYYILGKKLLLLYSFNNYYLRKIFRIFSKDEQVIHVWKQVWLRNKEWLDI